jgi:hypothetical protein
MKQTYEELELRLWKTEYQLANANGVIAQMAMRDLEPRISQREKELMAAKRDAAGAEREGT